MNDLRERQARAVNRMNELVRRATSGKKRGRVLRKAKDIKIVEEYDATWENANHPENNIHVACTITKLAGEEIFIFCIEWNINGATSSVDLNANAFSFPCDETEELDCTIETNGLLHIVKGEAAVLLKKIFDMM